VATAVAKVLLVDDSKFLRMANERALSKAGYQVSTAADGQEALQTARDTQPDIILLDMLLPRISGQQVLKTLKADPLTANIPVIVLSSLSQKNEEKLLQDGAAAYFEKSTLALDKNSDRLAATVDEFLRRINHKKDLERLLQEAAARRSAAADPPAGEQEIEIVAVESTACTITIPQPLSKS